MNKALDQQQILVELFDVASDEHYLDFDLRSKLFNAILLEHLLQVESDTFLLEIDKFLEIPQVYNSQKCMLNMERLFFTSEIMVAELRAKISIRFHECTRIKQGHCNLQCLFKAYQLEGSQESLILAKDLCTAYIKKQARRDKVKITAEVIKFTLFGLYLTNLRLLYKWSSLQSFPTQVFFGLILLLLILCAFFLFQRRMKGVFLVCVLIKYGRIRREKMLLGYFQDSREEENYKIEIYEKTHTSLSPKRFIKMIKKIFYIAKTKIPSHL